MDGVLNGLPLRHIGRDGVSRAVNGVGVEAVPAEELIAGASGVGRCVDLFAGDAHPGEHSVVADLTAVAIEDDGGGAGIHGDLLEHSREGRVLGDGIELDTGLEVELAVLILPCHKLVGGIGGHSGNSGHEAAVLDLLSRGVTRAALSGVDVEGNREGLLLNRSPLGGVDDDGARTFERSGRSNSSVPGVKGIALALRLRQSADGLARRTGSDLGVLTVNGAASENKDHSCLVLIHILRGEGHIAGHLVVGEAVRGVDTVVQAVQPADEHLAGVCADCRDGRHARIVLHLIDRVRVAAIEGAVRTGLKCHIVLVDRPLCGEYRHRADSAEFQGLVPTVEAVAGAVRIIDTGDRGAGLAGDILGAVASRVHAASVVEDRNSLGQLRALLILGGEGHRAGHGVPGIGVVGVVSAHPADEVVVGGSHEHTLIQQVDIDVLSDDQFDGVTAASASIEGDSDIGACNIRERLIRSDLGAVGQLNRTVGVDDRAFGDLDVLLGVAVRVIRVGGVGAGHGRIVIRLDLDAPVISLGAFQTVLVVRRDDDIVLFLAVGTVQLAVLAGQLDGTIRVDLGPGCDQAHVAGRDDVSARLVGVVARLPIQERMAAVNEGIRGQSLDGLVLSGVDLDRLSAAVVGLIGQDDHIGVGGIAILVDVDGAAVGLVDGQRTIGLQHSAVGQGDGLVALDHIAAGGDRNIAGGIVAGHIAALAIAVGGDIVASGVGITVAGDRDGPVVVHLIPLSVPSLIHTLVHFDDVTGSLEGTGTVSLSVPSAEGPAIHAERILTQGRGERGGVIGTHGVLDVTGHTVIGLIGDLGGVVVALGLAPLSVERHAVAARFHSDGRVFIISGTADAVFSGVPAREGLIAVGEGVCDSGNGFAFLDDHDHIVAGAAVGLVDHGDIASRGVTGQLVIRVDGRAVGLRFRQDDRAVGLDDGSLRNLDVLAARIGVRGVLGPVDGAALVLDLDAAVRLRGDLAALVGSDDNIVVRVHDRAVLTGELHASVSVDLHPLCMVGLVGGHGELITSQMLGLIGLLDPVDEGVASPIERAIDESNLIALDDLDQHIVHVLAVIDGIGQGVDRLVGFGVTVLVGHVGVRAVRAGDGDGAFALAVAVRIRAVDDDGAVGQKLAAVGQSDLGAVRQDHAAVLGDDDLAGGLVAGRVLSTIALGRGVVGGVVGVAVLARDLDGAISIDLIPLSVHRLVLTVGESQSFARLIELAAAVLRLTPTAEGPAVDLEGAVLELALQDGVSLVAHKLGFLPGGAVVGLVDDVGGILILLIPHCIQGEIVGNHIILGIGLAVAGAVVVPAAEHAVGRSIEQAAHDRKLAFLADLLLHLAGAVVGIIGDGHEAFGEAIGDLVVRADRAAARAVGVLRQDDGAVGVDRRAAGNGDVLGAVFGVLRVLRAGDRRGGVVGHRHTALDRLRRGSNGSGVGRERGVAVVRLHDHIVLVVRRGEYIVRTGQNNGAVRALVGDGEGCGLAVRCHIHGHAADVRTDKQSAVIHKGGQSRLVAVKGRHVNGRGLAGVDIDGLVVDQLVTVVHILDGQYGLILSRTGGLVVVGNGRVRVQPGEGQRVVGVPVGQSVRRTAGQRIAGGGDAHQGIPGLDGRVDGQVVALDNLVRVVLVGSAVVHDGVDRHRDVIGLIVEVNGLGVFGHGESNGVLSVAEMVLVVHQILLRRHLDLLSHHSLDGILVEQLAVVGAGIGGVHDLTEVVVDSHSAGGLLLIEEVDLELGATDIDLIEFTEIVLQRPAGEALRHSFVGLAHTGLVHSRRGQLVDDVVIHSARVDDLVQCLAGFIQLGLVHGDILDIAKVLGVVDNVLGRRSQVGHDAVAAHIERCSGLVTGRIGITVLAQIQLTGAVREGGVVDLGGIGVEHSDDALRTVRLQFLQREGDLAGRRILKGDLVGVAQRHILDQGIRQCEAIHHRCHDLHGLALAVTSQHSVCHTGQRSVVAVHLLDGDGGCILHKVVDDSGIDCIGHVSRSGRVLACDSVGNGVVGIARHHVAHIVRTVGNGSTVALGDHLLVAVKQVRSNHEFDRVGDEVGLRDRIVTERHGVVVAVVEIRVADRHELLVQRSGRAHSGAHQGIAVDGGRPDVKAVAFLQRVAFGVAAGGVQVGIIRVVLQHHLHRIGARDDIGEGHRIMGGVAGGGHILAARALERIALHIGSRDDSLHILHGSDRIGLEHLAAALQIYSDLRVLVSAGVLVPERYGLTSPVLHEEGAGIAVRRDIVAGGCGPLSRQEGVAFAGLQAREGLAAVGDLLVGSHILLDDDQIPQVAGVLVGHHHIADAGVGVAVNVLHRSAVDHHTGGFRSGSVVLDVRGLGSAGEVQRVAAGDGAAVLAIQFCALLHSHHSHVSGVLGVLKVHRNGVRVNIDVFVLRVGRVAGNGRGGDQRRRVLFDLDGVALHHRVVVLCLDGDAGHVVLVGHHDLDGAALVRLGSVHGQGIAIHGRGLAVHGGAGQLETGDLEHGHILGLGTVSDGLAALEELAVRTHADDMDGDQLLVDGLILKLDRLVLGDAHQLHHRLRIGSHGVAVDAGRDDRQILAVHHLVLVLIVGDDIEKLAGVAVRQLDGNGMDIGHEVEGDLGRIRRVSAGRGDRLLHVVRRVSVVQLVAVGRCRHGDELRLVLDARHLIGADLLVAVGAVHQLDQDVSIVGGVLLIEELHVLRHIIIADEEGMVAGGVHLDLVARDLRGVDGDGLASGQARIAGGVQLQDLAVCVAHIGVDLDVLGPGLVGVGDGNVVDAVILVGARHAVVLSHQHIVAELGRILRALVGSLPPDQHAAVEGTKVALGAVRLHIDRLVVQIARRLIILEGDLVVGLGGGIVLARRLRRVTGQVRGRDGDLFVDLVLYPLRGEVRDGVAFRVDRLDGDLNHVPAVVEHHDLVAGLQIDGIGRRFVGGVQLAGVRGQRHFVFLVVRLRAIAAGGAGDDPLFPRPAVDRLRQNAVLGVADGGVLPELHVLIAGALPDAHHIDRGGLGIDRAVGRADGDVRADVVHRDDGDAVAVSAAAVQMLLLDGDLGIAIPVLLRGRIGRPGNGLVIRVLYGVALLGQLIAVERDVVGVRHGQVLTVDLIARVGGEGGGVGLAVPRFVGVVPGDIGRSVLVHLIPAEIDLFIVLSGGVGDRLTVAVVHGDALTLVRDGDGSAAAVFGQDRRFLIVRVQRVGGAGGDLIPAGDGGAVLIHRAVQDKGIGRAIGRDGHRAASQVDLAGFGDVQIDTGGVGVDFAAGVGAAGLIAQRRLFEQQLVTHGIDLAVPAGQQQGDGVVLHSLLQSGVGSAIVGRLSSSSSSSLPLIKLRVGVHACCRRDAAGNCVFYKVLYEVSARIHAVIVTIVEHVDIADNCQRTPLRAIAVTGILVANHIAGVFLIGRSRHKRVDLGGRTRNVRTNIDIPTGTHVLCKFFHSLR